MDQSIGVLAFMATVTAYLLGRALGAEGPAEVVVYGFSAALGLEFLVATWTGS